MKALIVLALGLLAVGCGKNTKTCYWCKEQVKPDALICKHCGKSPNSAAENGQPDNPSSGGPKNKPPADSWANESHPDQVSIREVETDKQEFLSA